MNRDWLSHILNTPAMHIMLTSFALLLTGAGSAFAAGQHSVEVRIINKQTAYKQTVSITEGSQANYVGPVNALNGGDRKQMIFNALLNRETPDLLVLQYQVELSGGPESQGRSVQSQSEVAIRPGDRLTAIECGPWTVKFAMDAKGAEGKKARDAAWKAAGLPNYRLTANVSAGNSRQQCRLISKSGVQSNVVDSIREGGRKYGFILNSLFTPAKEGPGFSLQYQIEQGLNGAAGPVQMQNEETLTLNKKTTISGEGYRVDFLLEGEALSKPATSGDAGKAEPQNKYGTVQLIH